MTNKIEIQILTPATREHLIQLRDDIRNIKGFEAFDLHIPPAPLDEGKTIGKMSAVEEIILEGLIAGVTHFSAEKILEYRKELIGVVKKIFAVGTTANKHHDEMMSASNPAQGSPWKVAIAENSNGLQTLTYLDETGVVNTYKDRQYSIDPEHTYAVLIGTGEYEDSANFSAIPPVARNINDMERILIDKRMVGIPSGHIERLYNENCIRIKERLMQVSRTKDIKTLFIYYSGHGYKSTQKKLSLIAKDTRNIDEELHNDIPYDFVEKIVAASPAEQKIILIDACHSGLATQGNNNNVFEFEPVLGSFTLASTSAEEASYFKKGDPNTFFTSYLVEIFDQGVQNINKMLSLNDIFIHAKKRAEENRQPAPECKSQLKNVSVDNYFISGNPGFSLESRLARPKEFIRQRRYEEAKIDYLKLIDEYPDNKELRTEYTSFEKDMLFNNLVEEGDKAFYQARNRKAAKIKYLEAIQIKYDEIIERKIRHCDEEDTETGGQLVLPKKKIAVNKIAVYAVVLAGLIVLGFQAPKWFNKKNAATDLVVPGTMDTNQAKAHASDTANQTGGKNNGNKEIADKGDRTKPANHVTDVPVQKEKGLVSPENNTRATPSGIASDDDLVKISKTRYWEKKSGDKLSFSIGPDNLLNFQGWVAGVPVSGIIKATKDHYQVIKGNVTGWLVFGNDSETIQGKFTFVDNGVPKDLNLEKNIY